MKLEEAYEELGVPQGVEENIVRKAYKKLALTTHPDKNPNDPQAHEKFQRVSEAYNRITNPDEYASSEDDISDEEGCQCSSCRYRGRGTRMSEEEIFAMFNFIFGTRSARFGRRRGGMPSPPMSAFFSMDSDDEDYYTDDSEEEDYYTAFRENEKKREQAFWQSLREEEKRREAWKKAQQERRAKERAKYQEEYLKQRERRLKQEAERKRRREQQRKEREENRRKAEIKEKEEQERLRKLKEEEEAKKREERLKRKQEKEIQRKDLFTACAAGNHSEVIRLIEQTDLMCYERSSEQGPSLLHFCVQREDDTEEVWQNRLKIAEYLMTCEGNGALDWGWVDTEGRTVLHCSAQAGDLKLFELLLANRKGRPNSLMQFDVNRVCLGEDGWAPLHYAAAYGHPDYLEALLANGAKVKAKSQPQNSGTAVTAAEVLMKLPSRTEGHRKCQEVLRGAVAKIDMERARKQQEAKAKAAGENQQAHTKAMEKQRVEQELLLEKKQKQLREKLKRQQQEDEEVLNFDPRSSEDSNKQPKAGKGLKKKKKKKNMATESSLQNGRSRSASQQIPVSNVGPSVAPSGNTQPTAPIPDDFEAQLKLAMQLSLQDQQWEQQQPKSSKQNSLPKKPEMATSSTKSPFSSKPSDQRIPSTQPRVASGVRKASAAKMKQPQQGTSDPGKAPAAQAVLSSHQQSSSAPEKPKKAWAATATGPATTAAVPTSMPDTDLDPEVVTTLSSMGFTEREASAALKTSGNSAEKAADWLFSHMNNLEQAVAKVEDNLWPSMSSTSTRSRQPLNSQQRQAKDNNSGTTKKSESGADILKKVMKEKGNKMPLDQPTAQKSVNPQPQPPKTNARKQMKEQIKQPPAHTSASHENPTSQAKAKRKTSTERWVVKDRSVKAPSAKPYATNQDSPKSTEGPKPTPASQAPLSLNPIPPAGIRASNLKPGQDPQIKSPVPTPPNPPGFSRLKNLKNSSDHWEGKDPSAKAYPAHPQTTNHEKLKSTRGPKPHPASQGLFSSSKSSPPGLTQASNVKHEQDSLIKAPMPAPPSPPGLNRKNLKPKETGSLFELASPETDHWNRQKDPPVVEVPQPSIQWNVEKDPPVVEVPQPSKPTRVAQNSKPPSAATQWKMEEDPAVVEVFPPSKPTAVDKESRPPSAATQWTMEKDPPVVEVPRPSKLASVDQNSRPHPSATEDHAVQDSFSSTRSATPAPIDSVVREEDKQKARPFSPSGPSQVVKESSENISENTEQDQTTKKKEKVKGSLAALEKMNPAAPSFEPKLEAPSSAVHPPPPGFATASRTPLLQPAGMIGLTATGKASGSGLINPVAPSFQPANVLVQQQAQPPLQPPAAGTIGPQEITSVVSDRTNLLYNPLLPVSMPTAPQHQVSAAQLLGASGSATLQPPGRVQAQPQPEAQTQQPLQQQLQTQPTPLQPGMPGFGASQFSPQFTTMPASNSTQQQPSFITKPAQNTQPQASGVPQQQQSKPFPFQHPPQPQLNFASSQQPRSITGFQPNQPMPTQQQVGPTQNMETAKTAGAPNILTPAPVETEGPVQLTMVRLDFPRELLQWCDAMPGEAAFLLAQVKERGFVHSVELKPAPTNPSNNLVPSGHPGKVVEILGCSPSAASTAKMMLSLLFQHQISMESIRKRPFPSQIPSKPFELEVEFQLAEELCSLAIGQNGANMQQVVRETGVDTILFGEKALEGFSTVKVKGPNVDAVLQAQEKLGLKKEQLCISPDQFTYLTQNPQLIKDLQEASCTKSLSLTSGPPPCIHLIGTFAERSNARLLLETQLEIMIQRKSHDQRLQGLNQKVPQKPSVAHSQPSSGTQFPQQPQRAGGWQPSPALQELSSKMKGPPQPNLRPVPTAHQQLQSNQNLFSRSRQNSRDQASGVGSPQNWNSGPQSNIIQAHNPGDNKGPMKSNQGWDAPMDKSWSTPSNANISPHSQDSLQTNLDQRYHPQNLHGKQQTAANQGPAFHANAQHNKKQQMLHSGNNASFGDNAQNNMQHFQPSQHSNKQQMNNSRPPPNQSIPSGANTQQKSARNSFQHSSNRPYQTPVTFNNSTTQGQGNNRDQQTGSQEINRKEHQSEQARKKEGGSGWDATPDRSGMQTVSAYQTGYNKTPKKAATSQSGWDEPAKPQNNGWEAGVTSSQHKKTQNGKKQAKSSSDWVQHSSQNNFSNSGQPQTNGWEPEVTAPHHTKSQREGKKETDSSSNWGQPSSVKGTSSGWGEEADASQQQNKAHKPPTGKRKVPKQRDHNSHPQSGPQTSFHKAQNSTTKGWGDHSDTQSEGGGQNRSHQKASKKKQGTKHKKGGSESKGWDNANDQRAAPSNEPPSLKSKPKQQSKKFQSQQQDHSKSSMGGGASGWGQPDPAAIDPWGAGADTNHDGTSDRHEIKKQNQFKGPAKGSSSTDTPATADNGWGASPTEAAVGWGSGSQTKTNAGTDSPRQHKALNRSRQTSKTNTGGSEGGWGTPLAEATDPWAASSNHQENVPAARKNKHKATKAKPLKQKHDDRGGKSETQYASTSTRNSSSKSKSHWEPKKDYRPINPQLQSQASSGWDAPSTTDTSGWGSQDTHSSQSQSRPATSSSRRRRANTDDDY